MLLGDYMVKKRLDFRMWQRIISYIGNNTGNGSAVTASRMFRHNFGSYAHIINVIKVLNKKGFIIMEKSGREVLLTLAPKGREIYLNISKICEYGGLSIDGPNEVDTDGN